MTDAYVLWPTLTVLVGSASWLVATKFRRGFLVSPFSIAILILVAIFGVRPLLMLQSSSFNFYGINIAPGFELATQLGLFAVVALIVGYAFGSGVHRPLSHSAHTAFAPLPPGFTQRAPIIAARTALALLILWLALMIVLGGGIGYLAVMFQGRSEEASSSLSGVPAIVLALPVVAALVISSTRFAVEREKLYTAVQSWWYWGVVALCVIPPSALGNRRFLIPSVVAVLIGAARPSWQRRVKLRWVVGALAAFIALAIFPFVRSAGSRTGDTSLLGAMAEYFGGQGFIGVLNDFFLSYDTEMFSYVAFFAPQLGSGLPFGFGRGTVGEALMAPLPAALTTGRTWSNELLFQAFGGTCGERFCPVPSVVGTLYSDLALPGLFVGMLVIGLMCAAFNRRILASTDRQTAVLLVAAAFTVVIVRGNPVSQLWIAAQCLALLLVINFAIRRYLGGERKSTTAAARLRPTDNGRAISEATRLE